MTRWSRAQSEIRALTEENTALRDELRRVEAMLEREQSSSAELIESNVKSLERQLSRISRDIQAERESLADWIVRVGASPQAPRPTKSRLYAIAYALRTGNFDWLDQINDDGTG